VVLGQVVYSKAGRDAGKIFVVTGLGDDNYVFITDGDSRRLEKSKKKKAKHLIITTNVIETIAQKISSGEKITNAEIRKALVEYHLPIESKVQVQVFD
jgi:Ribosomal protein L14E/L6E/L27E